MDTSTPHVLTEEERGHLHAQETKEIDEFNELEEKGTQTFQHIDPTREPRGDLPSDLVSRTPEVVLDRKAFGTETVEHKWSPSQSPVAEIKQSIPMDFPDALREVLSHKKIARLDWETEYPDLYVTVHNGVLSIYTTNPNPPTELDGTVKEPGLYPYMLSDADLRANDWAIVW